MPGDHPQPVWDLTTVADDEVVYHRHSTSDDAGVVVIEPLAEVVGGLEPDTALTRHGIETRTLARPPGELLCRFATVNDVHFGEVECGKIGDLGDAAAYLSGEAGDAVSREEVHERLRDLIDHIGPAVVKRAEPGALPYPEVMSRAAAAEIAAIAPAAVVAKGDLTDSGLEREYAAFLDCYQAAFGDRLVHVRGNHDAMSGRHYANDLWQEVVLPGVILAVLDTVVEGRDTGRLRADQLEWLDELGARADRPVLVFGHHHSWKPGSRQRPPGYFGINPDDSEQLVEVIARRSRLCGYFAGHTHRNRVRRFEATGEVPYVEVASVKDFPGSWAEYRVYDGGILQIHRRSSTPETLRWSEDCRRLFWGMYPGFAFGRLEDRCFAISPRA